MTAELYQKWSPYNFSNDQWREAAQRYVELLKRIQELEASHFDGDHQEFVRCEVCEELAGLNHFHDQFSAYFSPQWARKLLEVSRG